jgi:RHS repeat-associated protein
MLWKSRFLLAALAFVTTAPGALHAEGAAAGGDGTSSVGDRGAAYRVSANGAATYTLAIWVPPGTRKLQPDLSFAYNSQGGNGPLGVGWNLSGLSQIARCGATYASDGFASGVNYGASDRFCLDGARLMNVAGYDAAPYYQNGSVYHTQVESWRKVVANAGNDNGTACGSGPCWFAVTLKDGTELEYGRAAGAQFIALDAAGQNLFGSGGSKQGSVRAWALSKITDRNGNSIAFTYTDSPAGRNGSAVAGAAGVGAYYISRIDYTANQSSSPAAVAQRSVQFFYATRPDVATQYQGGARVTSGARLAGVTSCVSAGSIASLSCSASAVYPVASYTLTYCDQSTACTSDFKSRTDRSVLYSIVECGADGTTCLPPNVFAWQTGPNTVQNINGGSSAVNTAPGANCPSPASPNWADFNGDGLPDWICANPSTGAIKVLLTSLSGGAALKPPAGAPPDGTLSATAVCDGSQGQWIDFAASGNVDWVCNDKSGNFYVLESNGKTLAPTAAGNSVGQLKGNDSSSYINAQCSYGGVAGIVDWADFNGDGYVDWICTTSHNNATYVYVLLSNGATLSTIQGATPTGLPGMQPIQINTVCPSGGIVRWLDFNGDGMADYTCSAPGPGTVDVFLSTGTSMVSANPANSGGQVTSNAACQGSAQYMYVQWADINGDGLPDWTCVETSTRQVSTLVSTGVALVSSDPAVTTGKPATVGLWCGYQDPSAVPTWADFNGDGLADLLCYSSAHSTIYYQLSSGTQIQAPPPSTTQPIPGAVCGTAGVNWIDFNGDRLIDWVCANVSTGAVNVLVGAPAYPDLATSLTNSLGGKTTVSYSPLTNVAVYAETAPPKYPGGKVLGFSQLYVMDRVPLYVVSGYTLGNDTARNASGKGYSYSSSLFYTNGRIGLLGFGWQGFETMTIRDAVVGNNLTVAFEQKFPFTGRVRTAVACTATSSSQQCGGSTNGTSVLYSVRQSYFCELQDEKCQKDPRYAPLGADARVAQVLLVKKSAEHASFGYRLEQLYDYDTYGNAIYQANLGDVANGTKPLYTCSSYSNSQSPWLIGFATNRKQSTNPDCPSANAWAGYQYNSTTDLSWSQIAYDSRWNVRSAVRWDDRNAGWLGKVVGRDSAGIGNIVSVATTNQAGSSPAAGANTAYSIGYDALFNTFVGSVATPPVNPANPSSSLTSTFAYDARFGTRVGSMGPNNTVSLSCVDPLGSASIAQGPLGAGGSSGADVNCLGGNSTFYSGTGVSANFTNAAVTTLSTTAWKAGSVNGAAAIYRTTTTRTDWANAFASARTAWVQTLLDGLGRPYSRITQGEGGNSAIDIRYLTRKRVAQISLPYAAGTSPSQWIVAAYDDYGRKKRVTLPYGGRDASVQPAAQPCSSDDITTTSTICWSYSAPNTTTRTAAANTSAPDIASTEFLFFNGKRQKTTLTNQGGTAVTRYGFDNLGRPMSVTDPLGAMLTATRDSLGRPATITDTANGSATTSYDPLGQLFGVTDAAGGSTQFAYDGLGRKITSSIRGALDDLADVVTYTYDIPAPSAASGIAYGNLKGRLGGVSVASRRNAAGNSAYAYGYDSYGRINTQTLTFGGQAATFTGATSPLGTPLQVNYPDTARTAVNYTYTAAGWLSSVSNGNSPLVTYSSYTLIGQPQTVVYGNGVTEKFGYTALGQVQNHSVWGNGAASPNLMANSYVWTPLGQVAQIVDCTSAANAKNALCSGFPAGTGAGNLTESYGYTFERLTAATGNASKYGYQYHSNGNLTQAVAGGVTTNYQYQTVKTAETYQVLTGSDGFVAKYDPRGNMVFKQTPSGDKWDYAFDPGGRLVSAIKNKLLVERYVYDYKGQRLQKVTYAADGKTVAATTDYIGPLMVRSSGATTGSSELTLNLIGPGGLIATRSGTIAGSGGYYFHRNPLNQSTRLVTDGASGKPASSILYQPYGATAQVTPPNSAVYRSKYQGHELDQATGLYYLGARYYDPAVGRFISGDKKLGGGAYRQDALNRYAMVLNDPVRMWDPDGREGYCNLAGGILGVAGFVGGAVLAGTTAGLDATKQKALTGISAAVFGGATLGAIGGLFAMPCNSAVKAYRNRGKNVSKDDVATPKVSADPTDSSESRTWEDDSTESRTSEDDSSQYFAESEEEENAGGKDSKEPQELEVCGSSSSFSPDTSVAIGGGTKPIRDIRVGDRVWAFDNASGKSGLYPVTRLHGRKAPGAVHIVIGTQTTQATAAHPFNVRGRGWVKAMHLQAGDRLVTLRGEDRVVAEVRPVPGAMQVYNFEVGSARSYYVSDAGVLVHNGGTCSTKPSDTDSAAGDSAADSAAGDETAAAVGDTVEAGADVAEVGVDTAAAAGGSDAFADVVVGFLALVAL